MMKLGKIISFKSCQILFLALTLLPLMAVFNLQRKQGTEIYSIAESNIIAADLREFSSSNTTWESNEIPNNAIKIPTSEIFQWQNSSNENNAFAKNTWDDSKVLPKWMKDYFSWHRQEMKKLRKDNWKEFRFLVMRCLGRDNKCGGTADRIKTIPYVVYWAARTRRILMIYWSRPAHLEEFLLPPEDGIDWRIPSWLVEDVVNGDYIMSVKRCHTFLKRKNEVAVRTRLQSFNGGSLHYNEIVDGPRFEDIYHDVWKTFFTPSPPVQKIINAKMEQFGLSSGNYASAHLRGLYAIPDRRASTLKRMAENAVKCASNLRPEGPVYFASDSKVAVDHISNIAPKTPIKVVTIQREYEPLHLEKSLNWQNRSASEYYDTFVDLYLIAMSNCVTYNMGGYGQWGLWVSQNSSCFKLHGNRTKLTFHCDWTTSKQSIAKESEPVEKPSVPLTDIREDRKIKSNLLNYSQLSAQENDVDGNKLNSVGADQNHTLSNTQNIPTWIKDYFAWHSETKKALTKENWKKTRYLLMQCRHSDNHCGGVSDRLRPMPFMILVAARSKRLLLIQWTKPFPLEEFLIPPKGGMDWTLPDWLVPLIENYGILTYGQRRLLPAANGNQMVARTRYQSNNHGSEYYNNITDSEFSFEGVYHHLFSYLFEPSPPVSQIITQKMNQMQLSPGQYSAAHFRALYGRESRPEDETKRVAINAVNCASELRPGGPVYFAADHKVAVDAVQAYSKEENLPVVFLQHDEEPLHLDFAKNWTQRSPSEYYATFVDLLILGQSRCLAFSNGGYGTFGLLLGFNASCSVRYFSKKILKSCPKWINA